MSRIDQRDLPIQGTRQTADTQIDGLIPFQTLVISHIQRRRAGVDRRTRTGREGQRRSSEGRVIAAAGRRAGSRVGSGHGEVGFQTHGPGSRTDDRQRRQHSRVHALRITLICLEIDRAGLIVGDRRGVSRIDQRDLPIQGTRQTADTQIDGLIPFQTLVISHIQRRRAGVDRRTRTGREGQRRSSEGRVIAAAGRRAGSRVGSGHGEVGFQTHGPGSRTDDRQRRQHSRVHALRITLICLEIDRAGLIVGDHHRSGVGSPFTHRVGTTDG